MLLSRTVFSGEEKSDEVVELGEGKLVEERLYDEEPKTEVRGEARSEKEEAGEDDWLSKDGSGNRVFWKEWLSVDEIVEDDQLRDLGTLENAELDLGDGLLGDLGSLENGELIFGAKPRDAGAASKNGRLDE